jgi:hypothetical protein
MSVDSFAAVFAQNLTSSSFITHFQPLPLYPPSILSSLAHTTSPSPFHAPSCVSPIPCPTFLARPSTTVRPPCHG